MLVVTAKGNVQSVARGPLGGPLRAPSGFSTPGQVGVSERGHWRWRIPGAVRGYVVRGSVCTALLLIFLVPLSGQQNQNSVIAITDEDQCHECRLELQHVVSIGESSDPHLIDEGWPSVVRDSQGRYLVASTIPRNRVLVYDSTGDYIGAWGRRGEGPGEFLHIRKLLILPWDSVAVLDWGTLRLSVFDERGGVAMSSSMGLRLFDIARLATGEFVGSGTSARPDRIGYPLHWFDVAGNFQASFGDDTPVLPTRPSLTRRWLARDPAGGVWAARPDRYELERWTTAKLRTAVVKRKASWFPNRKSEGAVDFTREPPNPWLQGVYVDDLGRVWVAARVAATSWTPADDFVSRAAYGRFYDSIIEVLSPDTGELLGSQRFPWYVDGFTNERWLISHRESDDGIMVLDVWEPLLIRDLPER